jgi:hypothetical protein
MACSKPSTFEDHKSVTLFISPDTGADAVAAAVRDYVVRFGTVECGIAAFDITIRPDSELPVPDDTLKRPNGVKATVAG